MINSTSARDNASSTAPTLLDYHRVQRTLEAQRYVLAQLEDERERLCSEAGDRGVTWADYQRACLEVDAARDHIKHLRTLLATLKEPSNDRP